MVFFSYNPPAISSISPKFGNTLGREIITIFGNSFSSSGTVSFTNVITGIVSTCSNEIYSDTRITCSLPPGQGTNIVAVTTASQNSTNIASLSNTFIYTLPNIVAVTPNVGSTNGGYVIVISGSNFGIFGVASIDGEYCPPINSGYSHSRYFLTFYRN